MREICFYAGATHLGGAERSLLELARGLASEGDYLPWVILPKEEGPLCEELAKAGIRHDALAMPEGFFRMSRGGPEGKPGGVARAALGAPGMARYLRELAKLARSRRPSLIHTNAIKCHAVGGLVAPWLGIPVLWHLRDILSPGPTLLGLRTLRRAAGAFVVANSRATARAFAPAGADVHVVHNGLDPAAYYPARNRLFNSLANVSEDVPVVGIVGALARWKGQLVFLRAARALADSGRPALFVVAGDEIYDTGAERGFKSELRREVERLDLGQRVFFAGFRRDAAETVNALDVLVHASIRPEPFGRVVVEAMACGVPLVASAAGGILEIVEDGRNGLLHAPGDAQALAAAVLRLLDDEELRSRLSEQGRRDFLERFTHRACVEGVRRVYDSIVSV